MPGTQFGLTTTADNVPVSASQRVEAGILQAVAIVPEDLTIAPNAVYCSVFITNGEQFPQHIVAHLAAGYPSALNPVSWTGQITMQTGYNLVVRAQASIATALRTGWTVG